jgi:hypothetical protein
MSLCQVCSWEVPTKETLFLFLSPGQQGWSFTALRAKRTLVSSLKTTVQRSKSQVISSLKNKDEILSSNKSLLGTNYIPYALLGVGAVRVNKNSYYPVWTFKPTRGRGDNNHENMNCSERRKHVYVCCCENIE